MSGQVLNYQASITNDQEPGVAYFNGMFMFHNSGVKSHGYSGEFRLEILGYLADEKDPFSGSIKKNGKEGYVGMRFWHLSLPVDRTGAPRDENHKMKGTITLKVNHPIGNGQDTWQADYEVRFSHSPLDIVGIGPTRNGEDFSNDYSANSGDSWESLMITDAPYDTVWWYVTTPDGVCL